MPKPRTRLKNLINRKPIKSNLLNTIYELYRKLLASLRNKYTN